MSTPMRLIGLCLVLAATGCGNREQSTGPESHAAEQLPEFGYVAAPNVKVIVEIRGPGEARVGEWITLNASRTVTGDWVRTRLAQLPEGSDWWAQPMSGYESEVAANLNWQIDPPGLARMNVPTLVNAVSHDRKVQFSKPGIYVLSGHSAVPIHTDSNKLTVVVHP
ncbi:hypothetical protein [Pseudoduganella sp. HUAS MS19]